MTRVFADSYFFFALLNPRDRPSLDSPANLQKPIQMI